MTMGMMRKMMRKPMKRKKEASGTRNDEVEDWKLVELYLVLKLDWMKMKRKRWLTKMMMMMNSMELKEECLA